MAVTASEESKDLTSLSLDELIGNLKVHEVIIKKDSEIVKASESEDEKYAMVVKDFKKFSKDKEVLCEDPNHLIGECPQPPRNKNQRAFVGGSGIDNGEEEEEKIKNETCLIAQASNEVVSRHSEVVKRSEVVKQSEVVNVNGNIEKVVYGIEEISGENRVRKEQSVQKERVIEERVSSLFEDQLRSPEQNVEENKGVFRCVDKE
ncbi:hypothetical protein Tco_0920952, partial [Tanacetum coccineum]